MFEQIVIVVLFPNGFADHGRELKFAVQEWYKARQTTLPRVVLQDRVSLTALLT